MRTIQFWIFILLISVVHKGYAQRANNDWENPGLPSLNTVKAHAWFVPYANEKAALAQQSAAQLFSLDGSWKFKLVNTPAERPVDFFRNKFDVSNWKDIKVPANWQTEGFDSFIFTDVEYPIPPNPPFVPADFNPVGSYKRSFKVPAGWNNKTVSIRFGAVNSFFYCWINEHYVGFSKDSKTPAEFDVTPYLQAGENTVSVQVFRFSDGTYLEGQDMWKLSGIERSVSLIARPKLHVYDYFVKPSLDAGYRNGVFDLSVKLNKVPTAADGGGLQIKILDPVNGSEVYTASSTLTANKNYSFSTTIPAVKKWTAETPDLYTLIINQLNEKGKVIESISQKIGFRTAEVKHGLFLINGVAVKIKGVNRHEHNMYTGKVITVQSMIDDIKVMKQFNINAVRASHYPNAEDWYRLCDEYGMYVVDEANIECDGMDFHPMQTLSDKPEWKAAYLDRTERMFERDKNHCSIITWSLGNESRFGENFIATYQYLKAKDNTRPVQYEEARDKPYTDIFCPMYKPVNVLLEYVKEWRPRPLILCEYAHMMGNGGGNLKEYWDLINQHPQLQGGFIWDFSDATFKKKDSNGREIWAYGRDMGNVGATSDTSFCADGLFDANRDPHPQAFELKKCYQPVHMEPVGFSSGIIRITNRFDFISLKDVELVWTIRSEGQTIASGKLSPGEVAAHESKNIELPIPAYSRRAGVEYFLMIEIKAITGTASLPAGHTVAWEQFLLPVLQEEATEKRPAIEKGKMVEATAQTQTAGNKVQGSTLVKKGNTDSLQISNDQFAVTFSKHSGWLQSYSIKNNQLLQSPLQPHFWRAPTDTDIGNSLQMRCAVWEHAGDSTRLDSFTVTEENDQSIRISTQHYLTLVKAIYRTEYIIKKDGSISVAVKMLAGNDPMPELPRFGMRVLLNPAFDKVTWFGRGPFDNYWDRTYAAAIDLYSMRADSLFHPYARAQESGYRTDVRWIGLLNNSGLGLLAKGLPTISTGVLHFNMNKMNFDRHAKENNHGGSMSNDPLIWWNIDHKQMGVGGDNSWGAKTHSAYTLPYMDYQYSFTLRPVTEQDNIIEKAR